MKYASSFECEPADDRIEPAATGTASGLKLLRDAVEAAQRAHPKILANCRPRTGAELIARALVLEAAVGNPVARDSLSQIVGSQGDEDDERAAFRNDAINSLSQGNF